MAKLSMDIPPIDSPTFWGILISVVTAPYYWLHRRLTKLEDQYVTKDEFNNTVEALKELHQDQTVTIRQDIKRVNETLNIINSHLLRNK